MDQYKALAERLRGSESAAEEQITARIGTRTLERLDWLAAELGQKRGKLLRELIEVGVANLTEATLATGETVAYIGLDAASSKGKVSLQFDDGSPLEHGQPVTVADRRYLYLSGQVDGDNYSEVFA